MLRSTLFLLILLFGCKLFAQHGKSEQTFSKADSNLIKKEKPHQFQFGHFFKTNTLYAILLDTSNDDKNNVTYCRLRFFEKVNYKWRKKNEFDSLLIAGPIQTRFCNYNNDTIKDYLVSAGIIGSGGNETEYLFIFNNTSKTLKLIKGFENLPSTSYNAKNGIITSIGLVAGIPSFEYYKIGNFLLIKVGGKNIWTDDKYGYLEKYNMVKGKEVIYYKTKKKLPFDLYKW